MNKNKLLFTVIAIIGGILLLTSCSSDNKPAQPASYQASGKITDQQKQPMAGVTLNFSNNQGTATTDANGNWSKTLTGKVEVTPAKEGYKFEPVKLTVDKQSTTNNFTAQLVPYQAAGKIVDQQGQPMVGVTLNFSNNQGTATTADDGTWSKTLTGTVDITPVKTLYAFAPEKISVSQQSTTNDFTGKEFKILVKANRDIYLMTADGTGHTNLTNTPNDIESSPQWSPDGSQIAYLQNGNICIMDANGKNPISLTDTPDYERNICWSPDGSKIAYTMGINIHILDINTKTSTQLTNDLPKQYSDLNEKNNLQWLDENRITYDLRASNTGYDICLVDIKTKQVINLTENPTEMQTSPKPHPQDPNKIIYLYGNGSAYDIYELDLTFLEVTRGIPINLTKESTNKESQPCWSPDGSQIAYVLNRDIWLMDANGSNPIKLTDSPNTAKNNIQWAADGKQIIYTINENIHLLDINTKESTNITEPSNIYGSNPTWRPQQLNK